MLNRRRLLQSLVALAVAPFARLARLPPQTYGHVTVANCEAKGLPRRRVRVSFNGEEMVGSEALQQKHGSILEADDERGFIVRYARNEHGGKYLDTLTGRLATERLDGHVEIRLAPETGA